MSDCWCKTCGTFMMYPDNHKCPPQWEVWSKDQGETRLYARKVYANDAAEAAEKWAGEDDSYGDHDICGGHPETVFVAQSLGKISTYIVEGEVVPQYYARFVENSDGSEEE